MFGLRNSDVLDGALDGIGPAPLGVAKYEHLRSRIAAAIENGEWAPGLQLPAELEIASRTQLSLGTVQRALRELVAQGYVVRRQGNGTFVSDRGKRMEEPLHCRFVESGSGAFLPVYTRLVGRRTETNQGEWSAEIGLDPAGYVLLDRVIDIDGRFHVASRMYLGASRFSAVLAMDEGQFDGVNLKKFLLDRFGVSVGRVVQKMRLEKTTTAVRQWIGSEGAKTVLSIKAIGFERNGRPVYFQQLWVPPTQEELVVSSLVD